MSWLMKRLAWVSGSLLHGSLCVALLSFGGCGDDSRGGTQEVDAGLYTGEFGTVSDFAAKGPFATTTDTATDPSNCTIFRPATLGEGGLRHPVILWGNGTAAFPQVYAGVLSHWASHGFIVAAANTSNAGSGKEILACLDFLAQRDAADGNPYSRHVDLDNVGVSGHSQGGAGAIMAGSDERVSVTAPLEPYIGAIPLGGTFDSASIREQKGPMFLMSGTKDTIAQPAVNQQPVYDDANVPVFWGTLVGADHLTAATGDISGFRGPATAWFRFNLMGDASARQLFYGPLCALCADQSWQVQRKNIE
jgi:hypothetical protein